MIVAPANTLDSSDSKRIASPHLTNIAKAKTHRKRSAQFGQYPRMCPTRGAQESRPTFPAFRNSKVENNGTQRSTEANAGQAQEEVIKANKGSYCCQVVS